jgi:hypothetical protein
MFPRHDTRIKPSIVDGGKQLSIPRLRASTDADGVGGAFQDEVASWMRIFEIDNTKLNGDYMKRLSVVISIEKEGHFSEPKDCAGR